MRLSASALRYSHDDKSSSSVKLQNIHRHSSCFMLIVCSCDEMVTKHEVVNGSLLKAPVRIIRSLYDRLATAIK
jgi:hypothetical protein